MSTAVIIGGGEFPRKPYPRELIRRADVIVCCDGHALKAFLRNRESIFGENSREPDAIVGDMDSLSPSLAKKYSKLLVKIEEQDDNDQTKAYHFILNNFPDVDMIHIIAAPMMYSTVRLSRVSLRQHIGQPHLGSNISVTGMVRILSLM